MPSDYKIFIAIPTYDGRIDFRCVNALMTASKRIEHSFNYRASSLLAWTFNGLWADALNAKHKDGYTHFLMVHADVVPEHYFADKMLDVMEAEKASILSVVLPIKNRTGLTSTAIDSDDWQPSRLTMKQIAALEMMTFSHPKLLVNTGLMMVDLRKPWIYEAHFTINDRLDRDPKTGLYSPRCQPEDWQFSRMARKANAGRICATKAIKATHIGSADYPNHGDWGWDVDQVYGEAKL